VCVCVCVCVCVQIHAGSPAFDTKWIAQMWVRVCFQLYFDFSFFFRHQVDCAFVGKRFFFFSFYFDFPFFFRQKVDCPEPSGSWVVVVTSREACLYHACMHVCPEPKVDVVPTLAHPSPYAHVLSPPHMLLRTCASICAHIHTHI